MMAMMQTIAVTDITFQNAFQYFPLFASILFFISWLKRNELRRISPQNAITTSHIKFMLFISSCLKCFFNPYKCNRYNGQHDNGNAEDAVFVLAIHWQSSLPWLDIGGLLRIWYVSKRHSNRLHYNGCWCAFYNLPRSPANDCIWRISLHSSFQKGCSSAGRKTTSCCRSPAVLGREQSSNVGFPDE